MNLFSKSDGKKSVYRPIFYHPLGKFFTVRPKLLGGGGPGRAAPDRMTLVIITFRGRAISVYKGYFKITKNATLILEF